VVRARKVLIIMKVILAAVLLAFVVSAAQLHSNSSGTSNDTESLTNSGSLSVSLRAQNDARTLVVSTMSEVTTDHPTYQIVHEAYAQLGYDVSLLNMPYARSWYESNRGKVIDAELARTDEVTSEDMIRIEVPFHETSATVYTNDPNFSPESWEALRGKRIDIIEGTNIIAGRLGDIPFNSVTTMEQGFRRLEHNRSDAFIVPGDIAEVIFDKMTLNNVYRVSPDLEHWLLYHYINKNHADLAEPLAREIARIVARDNIRLRVQN